MVARAVHRAAAAVLLGCSVLLFTAVALADAEGAKKNLAEARKAADDERYRDAEISLKLAEAELTGIDRTVIATTAKEIAEVRSSVAKAQGDTAKAELIKGIEFNLRQAKENLGNADAVKEYTENAEQALNSDEGRKFLDAAARANYAKQFASYRAAGAAMAVDDGVVRVNNALKRAEQKLPDVLQRLANPPDASSSDVQNFDADLRAIEAELKDLPSDHEKIKPVAARFAKLAAQFRAQADRGASSATLARLKSAWEMHREEWDGWEKETSVPTFKEFVGESSNDMSHLRQVKTAALYTRATTWLDELKGEEAAKAVAHDPQAKALAESVTKQRDAALAKLVGSIEKVLAEAEGQELNKNQAEKLGYFGDTVRLMLNNAPQQKALQERAQRLIDGFATATAGVEREREARLAGQTREANRRWPEMVAGLSVVDGASAFDPKNPDKSKLYSFKNRRNRAGYEYASGGEFDFIMAVNGVPLVTKYDPAVAKAVNAAYEELKYDASYHDAEEVVIQILGTARVQQQQWSAVLEKHVPTFMHDDVPLGRIVAIKCGPIAVVTKGGEVTVVAADTSSSGVGGAASSSAAIGNTGASVVFGGRDVGAWTWRVLTLFVGLSAAACVLLKANLAPLASIPQAGVVRTKLGDDNLAYIGICFAVLGVISLIRGTVIYGLLTSLAIVAGGMYVALDLLVAKGVVKPDLAVKIKPLGVKIGLACAVLVALSFITGGSLAVI